MAISDEMLQAALDAGGDSDVEGLRAALAAVEPLIRADEREACAQIAAKASRVVLEAAAGVAETRWDDWTLTGPSSDDEVCSDIAMAIRALMPKEKAD